MTVPRDDLAILLGARTVQILYSIAKIHQGCVQISAPRAALLLRSLRARHNEYRNQETSRGLGDLSRMRTAIVSNEAMRNTFIGILNLLVGVIMAE